MPSSVSILLCRSHQRCGNHQVPILALHDVLRILCAEQCSCPLQKRLHTLLDTINMPLSGCWPHSINHRPPQTFHQLHLATNADCTCNAMSSTCQLTPAPDFMARKSMYTNTTYPAEWDGFSSLSIVFRSVHDHPHFGIYRHKIVMINHTHISTGHSEARTGDTQVP